MKDSQFAAVTYDLFMKTLEPLLIKKWRQRLWQLVKGPRVLEAGVGTGLNIAYYKPYHQITAIDINESFLKRARKKVRNGPVQVELITGDVRNLPFPAATFDSAVTTFLFCQLPDPLPGLKEMKRVLKPNGKLLLLEHVRPNGRLESLISALSGPLYRLSGEQIAHDTEAFVKNAGFANVTSTALFLNIVKLVQAVK